MAEITHVAVPALDGTMMDREAGQLTEQAERETKYNSINQIPYSLPPPLLDNPDDATIVANRSDPVRNDDGTLIGASSFPTGLFGVRFLANWSIPGAIMHLYEFATLVVLAMALSTGVGTVPASLGTWSFWVIWGGACGYFAFWAVALFSRGDRGNMKTRRRAQLEQYLASDIFHFTLGLLFYAFATAGTAILYLEAPPPYNVVTQTGQYIAQQLFYFMVANSCCLGLGLAALRNTVGLTAIALVRYRTAIPMKQGSVVVTAESTAAIGIAAPSSPGVVVAVPSNTTGTPGKIQYERTADQSDEQTEDTETGSDSDQAEQDSDDEEKQQQQQMPKPKTKPTPTVQPTAAKRTAVPIDPAKRGMPIPMNRQNLAMQPPQMVKFSPSIEGMAVTSANKPKVGVAARLPMANPPKQGTPATSAPMPAALVQRRQNATKISADGRSAAVRNV
jgi:hypothetical protein